jgi:hypothetical protein
MHSRTKPKSQSEHFRAKAVECLDRSLRVPDHEYQRNVETSFHVWGKCNTETETAASASMAGTDLSRAVCCN